MVVAWDIGYLRAGSGVVLVGPLRQPDLWGSSSNSESFVNPQQEPKTLEETQLCEQTRRPTCSFRVAVMDPMHSST